MFKTGVVKKAITIALLYLFTISLIVLGSITLSSNTDVNFAIEVQVASILIATSVLVLISKINTGFWFSLAPWVYLISLVFLILLPFVSDPYSGSTRWISVGVLNFQPSELAKFGFILLQARILFATGEKINHPTNFFKSMIYLLIPVVLIMMQPDLGTSVLLIGTWFVMFTVSKIKKSTLLLLLSAALLLLPITYPFLADYQKQRITAFFNPTQNIQGSGYNVAQATIAIGSGGLFGKGLDAGSQSTLNFIPSQHTDFIFAVVAEKMGFIVAFTVILALSIIIIGIVYLAWSSRSEFARYFGIGLAAILFLQFVVNVGMNLGLTPVTGVPLPFVSYGGSHIVFYSLMIGVLFGMTQSES